MWLTNMVTKIEEKIYAITINQTRITSSGFLAAKLLPAKLNFAY